MQATFQKKNFSLVFFLKTKSPHTNIKVGYPFNVESMYAAKYRGGGDLISCSEFFFVIHEFPLHSFLYVNPNGKIYCVRFGYSLSISFLFFLEVFFPFYASNACFFFLFSIHFHFLSSLNETTQKKKKSFPKFINFIPNT